MQMVLILGVTASGKGSLAFDLARQIDAEIISIDSMKVYRRMDVGTAKPAKERQKQAKYHLIDVVEPSETFSVGKLLELSLAVIEQIRSKNKPVIAVGGSTMYIKTLLFGLFDGPPADEEIRKRLLMRIEKEGSEKLYQQLAQIDPKAIEKIHPNNTRRIVRALEVHELTGKPISSFQTQFDAENPLDDWKIIGLRREKQTESSRINKRVKIMIESGLVEEVRSLLAEEKPLSPQASEAIGYAEMIDHLQGSLPLEQAAEKIKINTRRMAKAQRTWFKTFKMVNWLDIDEDDTQESVLSRAISLL